MQADFNTIYREGCIAYDARTIVGALWVEAETGSEGEALLDSVETYLKDRGDIAMAFCYVAVIDDECDIPF
jgi:hypothetical protein